MGQISGIEGLTIPAPLELAIDGAYVQSDLLIESLSLRAGQSRVRLRGGVKRVDQPGLELDLRLDAQYVISTFSSIFSTCRRLEIRFRTLEG